jgi:hypothetical protein
LRLHGHETNVHLGGASQLGGAAENLIGPDKINFVDSIKNNDADLHATLLRFFTLALFASTQAMQAA